VRRNAPITAARIARVATVMLLAALGWELIEYVRLDSHEWPLFSDYVALVFVVELVLVSRSLWRALAGARTPAWLPTALALQGAVALAFLAGRTWETARFVRYWTNASQLDVAIWWLQPLWLSLVLQSAAGLRALSVSRRGSTSAS
jgi:uncharacterized membrane protein